VCSKHFQELLSVHKIDLTNRITLVESVCKMHNVVNERLGKPQFSCKESFDLWGGDCGCEAKEEHKKREKKSEGEIIGDMGKNNLKKVENKVETNREKAKAEVKPTQN